MSIFTTLKYKINGETRYSELGKVVFKRRTDMVQWCEYQNHNDPIYEVNDLFLTWHFTI